MKKYISIASALIASLALCLGAYLLMGRWSLMAGELNSFELNQNNHGVYREYYNPGQLKSVDTYSKGLKDGVSILFDKNGDTTEVRHYQQGHQHGVAKYFVAHEVLVLEENYYFGELIHSQVMNDSLYKYSFMAYRTGQSLFESQCQSCHLEQNQLVDWNRLDPQKKQNLDQVHFPDSTNNFFLPLVNTPDYQVIIQYLDEELKVNEVEPSSKIVFRTKRKRLVLK